MCRWRSSWCYCGPGNWPASLDHLWVEKIDSLSCAVLPQSIWHSRKLRRGPVRTIST
jgi:hypothetical protein